MTRRVGCPAAPGPLEEYAARFAELFSTVGQRRGFRDYLGPGGRNKTLSLDSAPSKPQVATPPAKTEQRR